MVYYESSWHKLKYHNHVNSLQAHLFVNYKQCQVFVSETTVKWIRSDRLNEDQYPLQQQQFNNCKNKTVTLSDYSEPKLYNKGGFSNKYYSAVDRTKFQVQSVIEAHRIKSIISTLDAKQSNSTWDSDASKSQFRVVIELGLVSYEEFEDLSCRSSTRQEWLWSG